MPYEGPVEAIRSVLTKRGVDPRDRISEGDQDPEYTACRSEEIDDYFRLYRSEDLNIDELHAAELAYWMDTSDPDEDNWWPITRPLLEHAAQHAP